MKKYALLVSFLLFSSSTQAGQLEDGTRAFNAGQYNQAMQAWLPLAEADNADAQYNMGLLYMKGLGVKKDHLTAIKWFKRAAHYGSQDAAYNLGVLYKAGEAFHPSNKNAVYWWKQAADAGHAESQYNMGVMSAYGYGIQKNVEAAIRYWESAANQGQPESRQLLYKIYSEGLLDVKPDPHQAARWR